MEIHCYAEIPLEQDEPVPAIRQFARILREGATDTGKAEIDLNLIGGSARAKAALREFRPERTKKAAFQRALEITEELTKLGAAKIKSLNYLLSAEGFRWRGSREDTSASLALLDGKVLRRNKRFDLTAHLTFEARGPEDAFIEEMLAGIAREAGIRFRVQASVMSVRSDEPGRAKPDELLVIGLAWTELIERVTQKAGARISLQSVPHLMTTHEAMKFQFDPKKFGKSVRVDFTRIVEKWLKEEFPDYRRGQQAHDGQLLHKEIADGLETILSLDKKPKAFSKEFTVGLGIGLTSPRFAPTPDRPLRFSVNLFRLFGIAPLGLKWTYYTEADLREALQGAAALVKEVLAIFEPEAALMRDAHRRKLEEFVGPREVSAKEGYELARPLARAWAEDAGLMRLGSSTLGALHQILFHDVRFASNVEGRLAIAGEWHLTFYSPQKEENLHVTVPCRGAIQQARTDAPEGRHWPSDRDQMLREGWIDSVEALRMARKAAKSKAAPREREEIQQFELSSRATTTGMGVLLSVLGAREIPMDTRWRISFSDLSEGKRRMMMVEVPAYGEGEPHVTVQAFDKHGRPVEP